MIYEPAGRGDAVAGPELLPYLVVVRAVLDDGPTTSSPEAHPSGGPRTA